MSAPQVRIVLGRFYSGSAEAFGLDEQRQRWKPCFRVGESGGEDEVHDFVIARVVLVVAVAGWRACLLREAVAPGACARDATAVCLVRAGVEHVL